MYTYNKKILFSDIDAGAHMSVYSILNAMQDCVNINSESIGKGIEYMLEKRRTWFTISWNIEIKQYPKMFDDVVVKTWPYDFSGFMGFRNVIISNAKGEDIICADSIWSLMDLDAGKPIRIEEEDLKGYDMEPRYPMEAVPRKIKLPTGFETVDIVAVRKSDVDYNGHMSNGEYIRMADEYLPMGIEPKRIRVEYKNQSRYRERLRIELVVTENEIYTMRFTGEDDGSVKAIVEMTV